MTPHVPVYRAIAFIEHPKFTIVRAGLVMPQEYRLTSESFATTEAAEAITKFVSDPQTDNFECVCPRSLPDYEKALRRANLDAIKWLEEHGFLWGGKVEENTLRVCIDLRRAPVTPLTKQFEYEESGFN